MTTPLGRSARVALAMRKRVAKPVTGEALPRDYRCVGCGLPIVDRWSSMDVLAYGKAEGPFHPVCARAWARKYEMPGRWR
jgi:hypothetical protein